MMPAGRRRINEGTADAHAPHQVPPYSITSSARCRREGGMVTPKDRAVFKLTASSNVVGCSIGRSPGWRHSKSATYCAKRWRISRTFAGNRPLPYLPTHNLLAGVPPERALRVAFRPDRALERSRLKGFSAGGADGGQGTLVVGATFGSVDEQFNPGRHCAST